MIRILLILFVLVLTGCATHNLDGPPLHDNVDVSRIPDATPKHLPKSQYGNPPSYSANGRRYYVMNSAKNYHQRGIASWYGRKFAGRLTSSREPYDLYGMTAASPVLPIPTFVRVTNLENGKQVTVKVNDRGPFAHNRIMDLSYAAAKKLGYAGKGTAMVDVQVIDTEHPYNTQPVMFAQKPHLYLQLGAFSRYQNAEHLKIIVAHLTHREIRIQDNPHHNQYHLYRVQIGPLKNVEETDALQSTLTQKGLGHAITVIS